MAISATIYNRESLVASLVCNLTKPLFPKIKNQSMANSIHATIDESCLVSRLKIQHLGHLTKRKTKFQVPSFILHIYCSD